MNQRSVEQAVSSKYTPHRCHADIGPFLGRIRVNASHLGYFASAGVPVSQCLSSASGTLPVPPVHRVIYSSGGFVMTLYRSGPFSPFYIKAPPAKQLSMLQGERIIGGVALFDLEWSMQPEATQGIHRGLPRKHVWESVSYLFCSLLQCMNIKQGYAIVIVLMSTYQYSSQGKA